MILPSIAVIGSTDCGKSTLIGALLMGTKSLPSNFILKVKKLCGIRGIKFRPSYLVDHMREEQLLESTLERTLAELKIGDERLPIIDTPGQLMLAGKMVSGLAEACIVVVVIDVMEQHPEKYRFYFKLISMLRIPHVVIAVNKIDLIRYDWHIYEHFVERLRRELKVGGKIPVVPVSALRGTNMIGLSKLSSYCREKSLLDELLFIAKRERIEMAKGFLMSVQDTFCNGKEKVALGMVAGGRVSTGDNVLVARPVKSSTLAVKRIYHGDLLVPIISQGENAGLVFLSGKKKVSRGDVLISAKASVSYKKRADIWLYVVESFSLTEAGLYVRCSTGRAKISKITINDRLDFQLLPVKKNIETLATNEFIHAKVVFSDPLALLSKKTGFTERIVMVNKRGNIVAIGRIN